jgi:hypothetical protein
MVASGSPACSSSTTVVAVARLRPQRISAASSSGSCAESPKQNGSDVTPRPVASVKSWTKTASAARSGGGISSD